MGEDKIKIYRVALLTKSGQNKSKNFDTKEEAQDYILNIAEKEGVKRGIILNKDTGEREIIKELE